MTNVIKPETKTGLRQKQLCEKFGWHYRDVARQAKTNGLSTHVYVQQQTGWRLIEELYYPPLEIVQAIENSNSMTGAQADS